MFKILFILVLMQILQSASSECPGRCNCKHIKPQAEWLRVVCKDDIEDIKDIDFNPVSVEMIHLDLSKNDISIIKIDTFKNLSNLKRLNLSVNKITLLDEGTFNGLTNLERLDLSKNLISSIDSHAFKRLPNLKRLKLNGNKIETLKEGTFHSLQALKQLDVSDNPWNCDCNLFWFSYWIQNNLVKLIPPPECDSPISLKSKPVKKLRIFKEFECKWSTPSIEIVPDQNQVVFAGDTMNLKCRAPSITNDKSAKLNWLWNSNITADIVDLGLYNDPQVFSNVKIENRNLEDSGIVASSLSIDPVNEEHSGQWKCFLVSAYGNISQAINVIVISNRTQYCPLAVTRGNKGMYAWPRTVVRWKVELPCEGSGLAAGSIQPTPRASYECNSTGQWENLNTEQCPYVSATTKILEQFSTVNISLTKLSLPKGSLLETIKKLKNITGEGASLTDPVEVNFVTQILENYASYLVEEAELGTTLIDVVNVLLNLPKSMLKAAEINYKACTRLIKTIEFIVEVTPSSQLIQLHKTNMALEEHRVKADSFTGLTCTWYSTSENAFVKLLHCSMSNRTTIINPNNGETTIEASIQLPATLLNNVKSSDAAHQLMVSMYADNKLFPKINRLNDEDNMDITSSIAGSKLIGSTIQNLTDPVYVMLRVPLIPYANSIPTPVVWDSSLNNQTGGWNSEGCHLTNFINNLIIFHCDRLGYYGLLQDKSFIAEDGKVLTGAKFKYSNPAIYVGSFILLVCLICTTVTYVCCYASIAMPKKAKHCVVNTWVAIALLCFLYTSGIQQTENVEICQGVGIGLHYLSLCCLFWMTVSANNMYKRLSKSTVDPITDDDELREQPIRKPVLGLYLVGWGIALIVCGISGAVNMREYAGYSHCFLTSTGSLAAVFVPAAILLVYLTVLHMLIRCTIRNVDLNGQLSEGTQATENVDLELLEPNPNPGLDRVSLHSSQTVSSEVEDQEHSQMTQLKGLIVVTIMYLIAWLCAAMTTANLLDAYIPYKETAFAILYAVSASSLGMFILLFYGIARSDVRAQWLKMRCWLKQKKNRCCRTRNVSDANPAIPTQPLVPLTAPPPISNSQATQITSDTNSLGSSRHTHKSQSSCNTSKLTANDSSQRCHAKPNLVANANLIMLHRQQYRSNNSVTTFNTESAPASVEMFYNPHQSGVARKFFKKQRRNMMKTSNLGPRSKHSDLGGATSDNGSCVSVPRRAVPKLENDIERNILSTSAKVNNTNIHVEMNPINDAKNVNILSDSGGSVAEDRNIALRYVIGQEHLGKNTRKVNNEPSGPPSSGTSRRKYPPGTTNHATCTSPYESDTTESKLEEAKQMRNVSQQCSLECSSEMESMTQIASERSEHNLSDISEVEAVSRSTTDALTNRRSSVDETALIDRNQRFARHRSYDMCNHHSGSLNSLPIVDRSTISSRNKSSYRSSLNDATSLGSSRAADDFDRVLLDRVIDAANSETTTITDQQDLLPFPTATVALASSETKMTSEDDEEEVENIANAVIPLVEETEVATGEALPLYDFSQRDERDAHNHHPHHHHHHHYHHKQHYANGKEGSREVRDNGDESDTVSDRDDESMEPEMMNVKKETSV